jgi:hypothetical protein
MCVWYITSTEVISVNYHVKCHSSLILKSYEVYVKAILILSFMAYEHHHTLNYSNIYHCYAQNSSN